MSTQPNLDYFVRAPTRQEVAHARLTGKRGDMYAWRSDARHPVFDPITGARCKQRHLFNPQPTQHVARRRGSAEDSSSCSSGSEDESDGEDDAAALVWPSAGGSAGDRRRRWKQTNFAFHPDHFKRRGSGRESGMHSAVNDGASGTYVPYLHDTILLCRPPEPAQREANDSADAAARTGHGRRTSVVLAVTYNNAEAGTRAVQIAEEAKNGELLSMSSLSPAPRQQPQQRKKSYAYASSPTHCFDEGDAVSAAATAAAVAAAAGAMRSSITGAPYAAVDGGARPYTASFDDDISTPGDTKLKATPVDPASAGHHKRAATAPSTGAAWCATVGPTLAGRQRVLAMAEGVYRDLVSGDAQHRTTLPTCELAYSLRASYTSGSHHRVSSSGSTRARAEKVVAGSSRTHLPRSATCTTTASLPSRIAGESSSLLGRSSAVPTAASPIHRGAHPVSKQRPVSANTAMGSSVIQGSSLYEKGPHRRTVTAVGPNGLAGSSFFEEVHEEASGNDEGTPPLPAAPALVREVPAVAVSAAGRRTSAARPSPPPSLHPQVVRPFTSDHSMTSSLDAVSRTVSAASPLGCDGATAAGSAHLTAPPTLSQFDLELQLTESVNGIAYRSTCKSSPMARESGGRRSSHMTITPKSETARWQQRRSTHDSHDDNAAGTATSRGVSSATEKNRKKKSRGSSKQRRGHRSRSRSGHHQHRQHSAGAAAALRAASGGSQRGQHSATQSTHKTNNTTSGADGSSGTLRLPSSAKETRVYAVRVRTVFTNADASPAASRQWREPPRHGVPVLLPNDWQLHS